MSDNAGKVLVGIDGSDNGRRAMAWALEEARLRHVGCVLVHAWTYGVGAASPYGGDVVEALRAAAQAVLDRELEGARASGVPVEGRLVFGPPAQMLMEELADATMLVVGSRGHGGVVGAILGSVSSSCIHHAVRPVVVIPPADRDSPADPGPAR